MSTMLAAGRAALVTSATAAVGQHAIRVGKSISVPTWRAREMEQSSGQASLLYICCCGRSSAIVLIWFSSFLHWIVMNSLNNHLYSTTIVAQWRVFREIYSLLFHLATSEMWCWSGGRGILTELYLYTTVRAVVQVGRLDGLWSFSVDNTALRCGHLSVYTGELLVTVGVCCWLKCCESHKFLTVFCWRFLKSCSFYFFGTLSRSNCWCLLYTVWRILSFITCSCIAL